MANPTGKGGKRFEKGKPGGPGRPPLPADVREVRRLNKVELERALNDFLLLTPDQLKKKRQDPETTMLEHLILSVMSHGTSKGDPVRLDFFLNRLVGKVKEQVETSGQIKVIVEDYLGHDRTQN
jgi:hypothetical protein